jgi:hypothetical protein
MKKLLVAAAVVAMPVGLIAATGGIASAKGTMVDVTNASITCTNVSGQLKFAPALTTAGGKPENTNVKLAVSGCTVSGAAVPVTVSAGKGAGVLHSASNGAAGLLGATAVTGQVNIKWASSPKLTSKMSTVTVTFFTGGTSTDNHATLDIAAGHASVSGDFTGGDAGANTTLHAETGQTVAQLTTDITPPAKGIKSVTIVSGNPGQPTPSSLHLG